jgi:hypothetical protein
MNAARTLIASVLCLAPVIASAASLPIDGKYGNQPGCHYAKTEESSGDDDFLLLTPDDVRTSVAFCSFKSIDKTTGDTITATLTCADEGESGDQDFVADVIGNRKDGYTVKFKDGSVWGPMKRCR